MRKLFLLSIPFIALLISCNDYVRYYRIQENGLYGFIDSLGNVVIEPQYRYVGPFTKDGFACVISDIRIDEDTTSLPSELKEGNDSIIIITYGYINKNNKIVIDTTNHIRIPFISVYDWGGKQLIKYAHRYIDNNLEFRSNILNDLSLCNGLFIFQDEQTKLFGYKDSRGKVKIDAKYANCHSFSNGVAVVRFSRQGLGMNLSEILNNSGVINAKGDSILSGYTIIQDFDNNGLTWALTTSISENDIARDWVQIDTQGTIKTGPVSNISWVFNNPSYPVCVIDMGFLGTFYSFLDEQGNFLSDFNRDKALSLSFDNRVRNELFSDVTRFSRGVAGKKGYIDKGQSAWQFVDRDFIPQSEPYDSLLPFSEGLAAVKELTFIDEHSTHLGKWGFVRMEGTDPAIIVQAIPFSFSECDSFDDGLAYFMNRGATFDMEGLINKNGDIVWQTKRKKNMKMIIPKME